MSKNQHQTLNGLVNQKPKPKS